MTGTTLPTMADLEIGVQIGQAAELRWTSDGAVLYALGVGAGQTDPGRELEFSTNNSTVAQRVLPTYGAALANAYSVPALIEHLGQRVDPAGILHADQCHRQFRELPAEGRAYATSTLTSIWDKGAAAVIGTETDLVDDDGELLCRSQFSMFFRGAGGWGGERGPSVNKSDVPESAPDRQLVVATRPDQPLLYRLSGDPNPLHTDPAVAQQAGFPGPIMHGMSVYGIAGRILLNESAGGDPARFDSLFARFTSVVTPGEELQINIWLESASSARFTVNDSSGKRVLSDGSFTHTR